MAITIPDDLLLATRMTEAELKREIAVMLFHQEKLTLAQAARLADMHRLDFQQLLGSRRIALHYTEQDLEEDLQTVEDRLRPAS